MSLAIRCERLVRDGIIADQSELADFGRITTARMSQILTLLNLARDLQEQIFFLRRTDYGRDAFKETEVRIAQALDWRRQRRKWTALNRNTN